MPRWVLVMVLMSGCAFSLSGPAPNRPQNQMPKCDTSKGLVVLDGIMATAAGVVAMSVVAADGGALALLPLSLGALYVGGAIHGSRAVDACHKEIDSFESSLAGREPLPLDRDEPPRPREAAVEAPQPVMPAPVVQPPPPPPPSPRPVATAKPAPKPAQADNDWGDFWREVQ